jgi:hypothetical protein
MTAFAPTLRRRLALIAILALVAVGGGAAIGNPAQSAEALPASSQQRTSQPATSQPNEEDDAHSTDRGFDPGLIISDYNFFNSGAMTEDEIQDFLESLSCAPRDASPCLWEFHQNTTSIPDAGAGHCDAYDGARNERASRILAKVSEACGISPRVLLVLLQKEQSLVTRPGASGYLRATGYGCPDTADCDAEYFGFFNQVYNAAWQFRQYTQEPDRDYRIGTVEVKYNPDQACGATQVHIRNQATANLYNYTPYQPNQAALANVAYDGDGCSAYGNLNFWILYNRWFGPTDTMPFPSIFDRCLNLVGGQPCQAPVLIPTSHRPGAA